MTFVDLPADAASDEVVCVLRCSRCEARHDAMAVSRFQRPVVVRPPVGAPLTFHYWALCPGTGEPILITDIDEEGSP